MESLFKASVAIGALAVGIYAAVASAKSLRDDFGIKSYNPFSKKDEDVKVETA